MQMIMAIAAGGAFGAVMRHYYNSAVQHMMAGFLGGVHFPWGIMTANILGSFLMGVLIALFAHLGNPPLPVKGFLVVGVLGAFTTFSTFSLDAVTLLERGTYLHAVFYMAGSVFLAVGGLYVGKLCARLFVV